MPAFTYSRVSSDKQADKDLSIPRQLKDLRSYAAQHKMPIVQEFVDKAKSARTAQRPEFQRMMALAKDKDCQADTILVYRFDRFARNTEDAAIYRALLRRQGVRLISISEPTEDGAVGRLVENVLDALAEFQSFKLGEDVTAGMIENASRGFCNGGPVALGYRYEYIQDVAAQRTVMKIFEEEAEIVRQIFYQIDQGRSISAVTKWLYEQGYTTQKGNTFTKAAVHAIAQNPIYSGRVVWNRRSRASGRLLKNKSEDVVVGKPTHPAIIDPQEFERIQIELKKRGKKAPRAQGGNFRHLLTTIGRCGKCGTPLQAKEGYYYCRNRKELGAYVCDAPTISLKKLDELVVGAICENILTDVGVQRVWQALRRREKDKKSSREKTDAERLNSKLAEKQRRLDRLYNAIEEGEIDFEDLGNRISSLKHEIEELRESSAMADMVETTRPLTKQDVEEYLENAVGLLESEDTQLRRQAIESILEELIWDWPVVTFGVKIGTESLQHYRFDVRGPAPVVPDAEVLATWERTAVEKLARKVRTWSSDPPRAKTRGDGGGLQSDFPMDSRRIASVGKAPLIKVLMEYVEANPEFKIKGN